MTVSAVTVVSYVAEFVSLSTDKTNAPICLDDFGQTKPVLSNTTDPGSPESAILYSMSKESLRASDVNISEAKSIQPFQALKVGLPIMALTATSLPNPNDQVIGCLSTEV